MKERLKKQRPYRVSFDKLFPAVNQGILEADLILTAHVTDIYFSGKKVVILIDKPKKDLEQIRIDLFDHSVLFNRISRKSHKQFSRR